MLSKAGGENQKQQAEGIVDNRDRLNGLYQKQVNANATGSLTLSGTNSYSGGTTISSGTLSMGIAVRSARKAERSSITSGSTATTSTAVK